MIHIITPFSRFENYNFYINNLQSLYKDIIWHPLFEYESTLSFKVDTQKTWIKGLAIKNLPEYIHPNIYKIQRFIETFFIIDEDYYCFMNDDDWIEDNVFQEIKKYNKDILFISMKRGDNIPNSVGHPISTLVPYPGVIAGEIGLEQIFIKGKILKTIKLDNHEMFDGLLAENLQKNYEVQMLPELFALFNYLEKGRWDIVTNNKLQQNLQRWCSG